MCSGYPLRTAVLLKNDSIYFFGLINPITDMWISGSSDATYIFRNLSQWKAVAGKPCFKILHHPWYPCCFLNPVPTSRLRVFFCFSHINAHHVQMKVFCGSENTFCQIVRQPRPKILISVALTCHLLLFVSPGKTQGALLCHIKLKNQKDTSRVWNVHVQHLMELVTDTDVWHLCCTSVLQPAD